MALRRSADVRSVLAKAVWNHLVVKPAHGSAWM